ncbi:MAG: MGMT family protein [Ktedonobacteraceae bacterium]|nr:MGMT family protein [Ktedonobacteraceae bacterium]MBV9709899.1 MGMT family protein [Ktedonobacteraceae bacterium]
MITHEEANQLVTRAFALVRACPSGRVTTYGWLARALGYPRGARMLGWIMNEAPDGVPAQRVINSKGELTGSWAFEQPGAMRQLLENEGILFTESGRVDLKRYGWDPNSELSADELQALFAAASANPIRASEGLLRLLHTDVASPFRASSPDTTL